MQCSFTDGEPIESAIASIQELKDEEFCVRQKLNIISLTDIWQSYAVIIAYYWY